MLTVQMMSGSVEAERRNGSSHSRYQGYTTGAQNSDAAIGQANASDDQAVDCFLIQIATRTPNSTANATINCGGATRSRRAKTGSLNRKLWT